MIWSLFHTNTSHTSLDLSKYLAANSSVAQPEGFDSEEIYEKWLSEGMVKERAVQSTHRHAMAIELLYVNTKNPPPQNQTQQKTEAPPLPLPLKKKLPSASPAPYFHLLSSDPLTPKIGCTSSPDSAQWQSRVGQWFWESRIIDRESSRHAKGAC